MRRMLVSLAWILLLLMITSSFGCSPGGSNAPDPGGDDPGTAEHGEETGSDPNPGEGPGPDPGDSPDPGSTEPEIPSTNLHSEVTQVPADSVNVIDRAIIRLGDLWLWSSDGRMWRQTDRGDVVEAIWAPDGHALVYFCTPAMNTTDLSLYYLVPGNTPILIDEHVYASKMWNNKEGFVWNPDSSSFAYATYNGEQMHITQVQNMTQSSFLLDHPLEKGPYWVQDNLAYISCPSERPHLVVTNAMGDLINAVPDTDLLYPIPGGMVAASGIYDPDGMMEVFSYTGMVRTDTAGSNPVQINDQSPRFCLMARNPVLPASPIEPKYMAISDCQSLFLQQYAGILNKAHPARIDLLSQDVFLTYSEFAYPFWFAWAPDGERLAALRFSFTQEGDYGQQEGYWDLVLVNESGWETLATLYYVSGDQKPIPFQEIMPLNWSLTGDSINFLEERADYDYDLWTVDVTTGSKELILETVGSLPEYRR